MSVLWVDRDEANHGPEDLLAQRRRLLRMTHGSIFADRARATPPFETRRPAAWYRPFVAPNDQDDAIVLFLPDGGLVSSGLELQADLAARVAVRSALPVCALSYSVAPEASFEEAWDDVADAVQAARAAGRTVYAVGVGVGAGLAISVALHHGGIDRIWAVTPWLDLSMSSPSYRDRSQFDWVATRALAAAARSWSGGRSLRDPALSPLFSDLRALPPTLVHVGDASVTRDEAYALMARAASIGRPPTLVRGRSMPHGWPGFAALVAEARPAIAEGARFLRDGLAPATSG